MKKEDLIKLRQKISELSEYEKKLRNLYLKKLANGKLYGPLLEIPSIDKTWLVEYADADIMSDIPKRSLYEDLIEYSKNNLSSIAIEYFDNKITYKELIDNVELIASSLYQDGIRKGDKVTVSMPYLPETIYTVYALNKLGAVVNMVDPRINGELMTRYIKEADSKYAIIIDKIEDKISLIKEKCGLEKIVSVSPLNSHGNYFVRFISKFKKSQFASWKDFSSLPFISTEIAERDVGELAVLEYTSGTSGNPKGVMLPDASFNSLAHFQFESLKNKVGDKFLLIMPPFIAYGLVIGMHDMLCQGQHLIMIPNFTLDKAPKMLGKLMNKYHPDYIMGVPNFLTILMNYKKDLSYLKGIIIGGDHLDAEIEKKARKFLLKSGSDAKIYKGWGMTELASCASFTKTDGSNYVGSVGITLSKNNVKILPQLKNKDDNYDIDGLELSYGEEGILFATSPAMTTGYYNNKEATDKLIYVDKQGIKWVNTGDLFEMNRAGALFFKGREKRIVVRPDGHNIPSSQIESIATSFDEVENSIVIGIPSRKYEHGSIAVLCISLKDKDLLKEDIYRLFEKIEKKCIENLQPRDRAICYSLVRDIPYTQNAKADHTKLRDDVLENLLNVFIDEDTSVATYVVDDSNLEKTNNNKILKRLFK